MCAFALFYINVDACEYCSVVVELEKQSNMECSYFQHLTTLCVLYGSEGADATKTERIKTCTVLHFQVGTWQPSPDICSKLCF